MSPESILYIIIIILVINFAIDQVLDYINHKTWKSKMPKKLSAFYTEEEYQKAKEYHREKYKLGVLSDAVTFTLLFVFLLAGGFAWLNDILAPLVQNEIWLALIYIGTLSLASAIIGLPLGIYNTFVIEEKYGFNKTSPKTYVLDKIKGVVLGLILGGGLGYLILWLMLAFGENFWWIAWLTVSAFTIFITAFYTSIFVPLFNKLKPLQYGDLRSKIEAYAAKVNFPLTNILEMDGSKRSSKANAFFSGIGGRKKIVLFDTLIEKHTDEELVAILAHEVGHYKKKHVLTGMITSVLYTGALFYILSLFIFNDKLSMALGAEKMYLHLNLIAFSILFEPLSLLLGLFTNYISRKHEFEADAFAASTADKDAFKNALTKLSTHHLSNLEPHPAYVFFHYSHPTLLQRLKAIED